MLDVGAEIGSWKVCRELGRGAMARVYEVEHVTLGSRAALKVLMSTDPRLRSRLIREGRTQSTLEHPNILRVRDVLQVEGHPALLMDRVVGPDLQRWMRTDRSLEAITAVLRGVAAGVAAAHAARVVHRDLKPANILMMDDEPRVADFGIAKVLDDQGSGTRTGLALGTPAYMAPEQVRNAADSDARADVYALGVIAWEMLTGERPIAVDNDIIASWKAKIAGPGRSIADVREDCPAWLAEVVDGALVGPRESRARSVDGFLGPNAGAPQASLETFDSGVDSTFVDVDGEASDLLRRYVLDEGFQEGPVVYSWRARPVGSDGEPVFVKAIVLPDADAKQVELAERQARVLRQVSHPAIPAFVETFGGTHGGQPMLFVVREWIEGLPLSLELIERRYSEDDVLDVLDQVGAVLAHLHSLQPPIVHRDVQPDNVIRRPDGSLALVDFGSVRDALGGTLGGETVAGTFGYMAPEQFAGDATPATDTYALGALAVALLGRRDPRELMDANRRFNWRDVVTAGPELESVLTQMLADAPEERFVDGQAALDGLRGVRVALATGPGATSSALNEARALFEPQLDQLPVAREERTPTGAGGRGARGWLLMGALMFVLGLVAVGGGALAMGSLFFMPTPVELPEDDDERRGELVLDEASKHCLVGFPFNGAIGPLEEVPILVTWRQGRIQHATVQGEWAGASAAVCLEHTLVGLTVDDERTQSEEVRIQPMSPALSPSIPVETIPTLIPELNGKIWNAPATRACFDTFETSSTERPVVQLSVTPTGIEAAFVHGETPFASCLTRAISTVETGPLELILPDAVLPDGTRGDKTLQRSRQVLKLGRPQDDRERNTADQTQEALRESGLRGCADAWQSAHPDASVSIRLNLETSTVEWMTGSMAGTPLETCVLNRLQEYEWTPLIEQGVRIIAYNTGAPNP